jgi:ubiquitin C-terminal hydrolase
VDFAVEEMLANDNKASCGCCRDFCRETRKIHLGSVPEILVRDLKRFSAYRMKLGLSCQHPDGTNMRLCFIGP